MPPTNNPLPLLHPVGTLRETTRQTTYYIALVTNHETTLENELFAHETLASLRTWAETAGVGDSGVNAPEYRFRNQPEVYEKIKGSLEEIGGVFRKLDYANSVMGREFQRIPLDTQSLLATTEDSSPEPSPENSPCPIPPAAATSSTTTTHRPPTIPKSRRFLQLKAAGKIPPRIPPITTTTTLSASLSPPLSSASSRSSSASSSPNLSTSSQSSSSNHPLKDLAPKSLPTTALISSNPSLFLSTPTPQPFNPPTYTNDPLLDPETDGPYDLCEWEYLGDTRDITTTRSLLIFTSITALQTLHSLTTTLLATADVPPQILETPGRHPLWPKWTAAAETLAALMDPRAPAYLRERQAAVAKRARGSFEAARGRGVRMVYTDGPSQPSIVTADDIPLLMNPDILDPNYVMISSTGPTSTPEVEVFSGLRGDTMTREQVLGGIPRSRWHVGVDAVPVGEAEMKERGRFGHSCGRGAGMCLDRRPEGLGEGWEGDFESVCAFPPVAPDVEGETGVCPYCDCIFSAKEFTGDRWRTHVIRDLQPYFCPLPTCSTWSTTPQTFSGFLTHLTHQHTPVLHAVLCNGKIRRYTASEVSRLQEIMEPARYEALMRNMVEVRRDFEFAECPFCERVPGEVEGVEGVVRAERIARHVEGHMLRGVLSGVLGGCEMGKVVRMVGYLRGEEGKKVDVEWPVEVEDDGVLIM